MARKEGRQLRREDREGMGNLARWSFLEVGVCSLHSSSISVSLKPAKQTNAVQVLE